MFAPLMQNKQTVLHIAARAEKLDCLKEIVPKVSDELKTATDKVWLVPMHCETLTIIVS